MLKILSLALDIAETKKSRNIKAQKFERAFKIEKDYIIVKDDAYKNMAKRAKKKFGSKL